MNRKKYLLEWFAITFLALFLAIFVNILIVRLYIKNTIAPPLQGIEKKMRENNYKIELDK